ncbi:hypothetical protein HDU79_002246 [Rhizoclosmatium sp. JEL0117]|nr:hypothetical protein HDU79_002246 [Rhizoclosmatium sp. JEL0117]
MGIHEAVVADVVDIDFEAVYIDSVVQHILIVEVSVLAADCVLVEQVAAVVSAVAVTVTVDQILTVVSVAASEAAKILLVDKTAMTPDANESTAVAAVVVVHVRSDEMVADVSDPTGIEIGSEIAIVQHHH